MFFFCVFVYYVFYQILLILLIFYKLKRVLFTISISIELF